MTTLRLLESVGTDTEQGVRLQESGGLGKVTGKNRWDVRIIAQGMGSSGYYTREALEETGPAAFPIGTRVHIDHQSFEEFVDQPAGSLKNLAGVITSTPEYKDDGTDLPGLYSTIEISQEYAPFVEQFAPFIGLSISANGYGEERTEEGARIIEGFIPSVLNTVDLVTAAGAKGALLKAIESYRDRGIIDKDKLQKKEEDMTPEQIQELTEALVNAVQAPLEKLSEKLLEAVTPVEVEEADEPDVAAIAEAVVEADLPKSARGKVFEAVKAGADVDEAIVAVKEFVDSIVQESATQDDSASQVVKTTVKESVDGLALFGGKK